MKPSGRLSKVYRREINARGWDALSENLSSCTV